MCEASRFLPKHVWMHVQSSLRNTLLMRRSLEFRLGDDSARRNKEAREGSVIRNNNNYYNINFYLIYMIMIMIMITKYIINIKCCANTSI